MNEHNTSVREVVPSRSAPTLMTTDFMDNSRKGRVRGLGHRPVLDGLRGVAWAAVFLSHANIVSKYALSDTGMFLFFGLSGFLITQIIVSEYSSTGSVKFRQFLKRRALRLIPALFGFLLVWFCVVMVFRGSSWLTTVPDGGPGQYLGIQTALEGVLASLSYFMNWAIIFNLFAGYVPIGHLWSLAVEMQFYIVWATLLIFLLRFGRKAAFWTAATLSTLSCLEAIFLMHIGQSGLRVYMGTDIRAGSLLAGSAAALIWSNTNFNFEKSRILGVAAFFSVVTIVWSVSAFRQPTFSLSQQLAWPLTSIASAVLVVYLIERSNSFLGRWMSKPIPRYLGRRSYALYLWHYVWLTWLRDLGFLGLVAGLVMSLVSAELSWRLIERPVLEWRKAARERKLDLEAGTDSIKELQRV